MSSSFSIAGSKVSENVPSLTGANNSFKKAKREDGKREDGKREDGKRDERKKEVGKKDFRMEGFGKREQGRRDDKKIDLTLEKKIR